MNNNKLGWQARNIQMLLHLSDDLQEACPGLPVEDSYLIASQIMLSNNVFSLMKAINIQAGQPFSKDQLEDLKDRIVEMKEQYGYGI